MSKQVKLSKQVKQVKATNAVNVDKAEKVWLAGLGAVSIAQKQAAALFESMVSEGKSFQQRSGKLAHKLSSDVKGVVESRMKPIRIRLDAMRSEAEARFETGVGRVMTYAGIPSKADVDALIARVDKLSRQLRTAR